MKRRQVITSLLALTTVSMMPRSIWQRSTSAVDGNIHGDVISGLDPSVIDPISDHENRTVPHPSLHSSSFNEQAKTEKVLVENSVPSTVEKTPVQPIVEGTVDSSPVIIVNKNIDFARDYDDDIFVSGKDKELLHSVALRLKKLQSTVGYGNFNIVSFDDALKFAKRFTQVGSFTADEIQFIEKIFSANAADYGFYGSKVTTLLTSKISSKSAFKVPHTGHYLLKEQSLDYYTKIRNKVGGNIILTSGIRSNVKQLHLFLAKVIRVNGNVSRASRSLAPPGYSYHGIGDFDVGRVGWGGKNFTDAFAETDEFKRMQDLGYIDIRYDHGNTLGVRFEPWHIKVV